MIRSGKVTTRAGRSAQALRRRKFFYLSTEKHRLRRNGLLHSFKHARAAIRIFLRKK